MLQEETKQPDFPTDETLTNTINKAHTFLKNAGKKEIFVILRKVGFSTEAFKQGLLLYDKAAGIQVDLPALEAPTPDNEAEKAKSFLDAWDEPHMPILQAFFRRSNPTLGAHFFRGGVRPQEGLNAVLGVKTLVERILKVRDGQDKDREQDKELDQNSLKELASLGYNDALWEKLISLVNTVMSATSLPEALPEDTNEDAEEKRQRQASYDLYVWYWLWATIVTNRTDAIANKYAHRLGVKRPGRPKNKKKTTEPKPTPPAS